MFGHAPYRTPGWIEPSCRPRTRRAPSPQRGEGWGEGAWKSPCPLTRLASQVDLSPLEGFAQLISDDSIVTNDSGGFGDGGTGGWSAGLGGRVGVGASGPDAG